MKCDCFLDHLVPWDASNRFTVDRCVRVGTPCNGWVRRGFSQNEDHKPFVFILILFTGYLQYPHLTVDLGIHPLGQLGPKPSNAIIYRELCSIVQANKSSRLLNFRMMQVSIQQPTHVHVPDFLSTSRDVHRLPWKLFLLLPAHQEKVEETEKSEQKPSAGQQNVGGVNHQKTGQVESSWKSFKSRMFGVGLT